MNILHAQQSIKSALNEYHVKKAGGDTMDNTAENITDTADEKSRGIEDIAAMQTVVCILLALTFFIINIIYPSTAEELAEKFTELSGSHRAVENPIDIIIKYWSALK